MKPRIASILTIILAFGCLLTSAQRLPEDTTTNEPFFKASKFNSRAYVGIEAHIGQILKTKASMNLGFSLNWVVNHKYVVSAKYHTLTSPHDITSRSTPLSAEPVYLRHHFAGLAFSYILFHDKKFSFQPELAAGWGSATFDYPTDKKNRNDYGVIIPAVYGTWNATSIFRLGIGLNYRAVMGSKYFGITPMDLSGVSGVVFLRLGTF